MAIFNTLLTSQKFVNLTFNIFDAKFHKNGSLKHFYKNNKSWYLYVESYNYDTRFVQIR